MLKGFQFFFNQVKLYILLSLCLMKSVMDIQDYAEQH